jgi:TorA maturation chaperone TorD
MQISMDLVTGKDWDNLLMGEILTCGLLSKALYRCPESVWLKSVIDQDVFCDAPFASGQVDTKNGLRLLQDWCAQSRNALPEAVNNIETDYMRLFVGPGKVLAPPWESVYSNNKRLLFQTETLQVRQCYRRFGLESVNLRREPDDHVGMEFGFVAHLAKLSLQALQGGDRNQFISLAKEQRDFVHRHMIGWIPNWAGRVNANARTEFYRGLAQLACGVVKELETVLVE